MLLYHDVTTSTFVEGNIKIFILSEEPEKRSVDISFNSLIFLFVAASYAVLEGPVPIQLRVHPGTFANVQNFPNFESFLQLIITRNVSDPHGRYYPVQGDPDVFSRLQMELRMGMELDHGEISFGIRRRDLEWICECPTLTRLLG